MSDVMIENNGQNITSMLREMVEKQSLIFKDPKYLSTELTPEWDWFYMRPGVKPLASAILSFLTGMFITKMVYVHGGTGSGKTSSCELLSREIASVVEDTPKLNKDYAVYKINCRTHSSSQAIAKAITGINKQYGEDQALEDLKIWLLNHHKPIILILDDIQTLNDEKLLYVLSRINSFTEPGEDVKRLMVIATSRYHIAKLSKAFTANTKSSVNLQTIDFGNYDSNDLKNILNIRAQKGLAIYDSWVINNIVTRVMNEAQGDARLAIKALDMMANHPKYAEWINLKREYNELEAKVLKDAPFDSKERKKLDEHPGSSVAEEFTEELIKIIMNVKGETQIDFVEKLTTSELGVLYYLINTPDDRRYESALYKAVCNNPKTTMTRYKFNQMLFSLDTLDMITRRKARINKINQIELEHHITSEVEQTIRNKAAELRI